MKRIVAGEAAFIHAPGAAAQPRSGGRQPIRDVE